MGPADVYCVVDPADVCVAPNFKCYANRQTDMSRKTYHIGVTNVEDLAPGSSTFSSGDLNLCPSDHEWGGSVLYQRAS